jgi:hypothetical protein
MFRNCNALVVKNRPLSDYEWMCEYWMISHAALIFRSLSDYQLYSLYNQLGIVSKCDSFFQVKLVSLLNQY